MMCICFIRDCWEYFWHGLHHALWERKLDVENPLTEFTDTMLACSPHVVTLQERISVGTEPISIEDFDNLVGQQEQTLLQRRGQEASALSHFEVMTALAYKHFQQQEACKLPSTRSPHL